MIPDHAALLQFVILIGIPAIACLIQSVLMPVKRRGK